MSDNAHKLTINKNLSNAGALLHALAPRAKGFCHYIEQKCVWSSDGGEDFEVDNFIADIPSAVIERLFAEDDSLRRTLSAGRTALAIPVRDSASNSVGLLVALFSKNDGRSSSFNPKALKSTLDPAIELISESLRAANEIRTLARSSDEIEKELEFVYDIDEKIHGASGRHSSLAQLVGRSGRYLSINYSVLLIPNKRIRISATHSSWKNVKRKILDRYLIEQLLPRMDGQRNPLIYELPAVDENGVESETGYQALLCPILDQQRNVEGILAQIGRVSQSKFTKSDRRFMSHIGRKIEYVVEQSFDAATGLMNRAGFEVQLKESFDSLQSDSDKHQLIYFDLDNLQLINDTFGRQAGDEVIVRFARLLEEDLPKSGVLSRLTGDDFCLLLTHATSEAALDYTSNLLDSMSGLRYLEGDKSLQVTMSAGIAEFDRSVGKNGNLLAPARMACEAAKERGQDRVEIFDQSNRSVIRRYDDMQLVTNIQRALDTDEFQLVAQPISGMAATNKAPRFEVLLRMKDGEGGWVETDALFSAAVRYRMMPQIDRWVVSTTIAKLAAAKDIVESQGAIFAMNLSGQSIGDDDFLEFIEHEIESSGISVACLCFEITESEAVSNMQKAQSFIDRLRKLGCKISLDDFGVGLSSFAYLKNFNVDTLKIDGSFIRDITENRISESMVAAITQVAKVMELSTIAEYVETEAARKLIVKLCVDYAQGHFIGKPVVIESTLSGLAEISAA